MRADVAAAEHVLRNHDAREVERLSREVLELGSLVLELVRRLRSLEAERLIHQPSL